MSDYPDTNHPSLLFPILAMALPVRLRLKSNIQESALIMLLRSHPILSEVLSALPPNHIPYPNTPHSFYCHRLVPETTASHLNCCSLITGLPVFMFSPPTVTPHSFFRYQTECSFQRLYLIISLSTENLPTAIK